MHILSEDTLIAGVDEVGRGAWAGPMVAAAVILAEVWPNIKDSKLLSAAQREPLSVKIKQHCVAWAIAEVSAAEIDRLGLQEANRVVMQRAIQSLTVVPSLVRSDGFSSGTPLDEEVYIKGDQIYPEIGAASIIAKVYRDQLMRTVHQGDGRYGFNQHVGYGTALHRARLREHGPSVYHRMSFNPMKSMYL